MPEELVIPDSTIITSADVLPHADHLINGYWQAQGGNYRRFDHTNITVNITDLPAAVASVPDGAVLLVRAGTYSSFTITAKGLTVLAEPATDVSGSIRVENTLAGQDVVLERLNHRVRAAVVNCAGTVVLRRIPADTDADTLGALLHEIAYAPAMTFAGQPDAADLMRLFLKGFARDGESRR